MMMDIKSLETSNLVMATIRQFGLPTFFITLFVAESQWPQLIVILVKFLKQRDISKEDAIIWVGTKGSNCMFQIFWWEKQICRFKMQQPAITTTEILLPLPDDTHTLLSFRLINNIYWLKLTQTTINMHIPTHTDPEASTSCKEYTLPYSITY